MKKLTLILYLLAGTLLNAEECLEQSDIITSIINIDDDISNVILKSKKGKVLKKVEFLNFIDVEKRVIYKDLDFDGKNEILVNISSNEKLEEYQIFKIGCNRLIPFTPSTLYHFELKKDDKKIIEYTHGDDGYIPKFKTYCFGDIGYYLCQSEEYFSEDISKIKKFNKKKVLEVYYIFKKHKINFDSKISLKNVVKLNNIAYYLQKVGSNKKAVYLLEKILEEFPKRTIAYYNLGDAYWALGRKEEAKKMYATYVKQMRAKGKEKRIPKVVKQRIEYFEWSKT